MRIFLLLLFAGLALSGCSSTRMVAPYSSGKVGKDSVDLAEVQRWIKGRSVHLMLMDGQDRIGEDVLLASDSVRWVDDEDERPRVVATSGIQRIEFRDHLGGALTGLAIGGAAGAVVGWGIGRAVVSGTDHGWWRVYPFLGGALGTFWGLIFGGISGSEHVFQFQEQPVTPVAAPPASESVRTERVAQ